jgi:uncharacterized integral membrane protein (TIGR00698 family)
MKSKIPGIVLNMVIGGLALGVSRVIPLGGVSLAIILGMLIGNIFKLPFVFKSGTTTCEKSLLSVAIALMGISLDYKVFFSLGLTTILIIVGALIFTISLTVLLGKVFHLDPDLSLLLGIGNAVCGSSAIAAAQGVIEAKEEHVGISIAAVNFFGTVGIFLLPALSVIFTDFTAKQNGIFIGNTLQAIGQVTAAGFSLGEVTGKTATIVKMGRILLITPLVLLLNIKVNGKRASGFQLPKVPLYIVVFIVLSIVNSTGFIPESIVSVTKLFSKGFLLIAMSAIGMKIRFQVLVEGGKKAFLIGTIVFSFQILFSMVLVFLSY